MTKFKNFLGELGAGGLILIFVCSGTVLKKWGLDNDAWFILNCGRYVVETGTIPHVEFATMHEGLHYVMEQWLTAAVFWEVYSGFGADGLMNFCWLVGAVSLCVYYKLCLYVSGGNQKISALLAFVIGAVVMTSFVVTRPQILSTLILLVEIFLLEKYFREGKLWALCILPVLSALLVNLHAAFWPMMTVLLLPFLAEALLKKNPAQILALLATALGIFLAGFANPYGWEAMIFLFTSYDPAIHGKILEMQATAVTNPLGAMFFVFSALLIVAFSKKSMPWRYFFLTFGLMVLGVQAFRATFLFLMLATVPLAFALRDWHPFDKIFNLPHKLFVPLFLICPLEFWQISVESVRLPLKIILGGAAIFLVLFILFYKREGKLFSETLPVLRRKPLIALAVAQGIIFSLAVPSFGAEKNYEVYKPALDFLLERESAEKIILWTGFNSGGYAEFRGVKCYMDARPEIFARSNNHRADIIQEYLALVSGRLDYEEFFARYDFTHIFVTEEDMLVYQLLSRDKNYRQIFEYEFSRRGKTCRGRIFEPVDNPAGTKSAPAGT